MTVARMRALAAAVAVAVLGPVVGSCSAQQQSGTQQGMAQELAGKVTADGMEAHLRKLQEIADANKGSRAAGTPGYDASVDYVSQTLRDKGFDVETPEFERLALTVQGNPGLSIAGKRYPADQASLLNATEPAGLRAITLRPRRPAGCAAGDYAGVNVRGAIAIVDDLGCSVVDKQNTAIGQGAVGLLVVSQPGNDGSPRGLFPPDYYRGLKIPVGIIGTEADAALRQTNAPVQLTLDSKSTLVKGRNILAQTKTGDSANAVLVGAHLDSAPRSAGINDNGSGVAAVLETAAQLGAEPRVNNAVRFAFWTSGEDAQAGSKHYVQSLNRDALNDIALYLNADMLGSPNPGYFTYDGDQSAAASPSNAVPLGSAGVERTLAGYLNLGGMRPADMPLSGDNDYVPFMSAGVPIGGVTTGGQQQKTAVQARLWGGRANAPFDPNRHTRRDTVEAVDRKALGLMGSTVAFAVGSYAQSIEGVNGVPRHDRRHRAAVTS